MKENTGPIWEGVYESFQEVPSMGPGFNGRTWVENSLSKIRTLHQAANEKKTIPAVTKYSNSLLPLVTCMVHDESRSASVLDFGGALGFTYYQVLKSLPNPSGFKYHIIEAEEICKVGRDFFKDDASIFFHSEFPKDMGIIDILHIGSSLHYVEKWAETLRRLCGYMPRYVLFTDLAAGDIPTYASAQNYYDSKIPVWFFNIDELMAVLIQKGYQLIFKASYNASILGIEQDCPQENFEERYRLGASCILLFAQQNRK